MVRSAVKKVMWVGRATVFLVGLSVILALVFGVASMAFASNGNPWLLGRSNVATAITTLGGKLGVNGPMLRLTNNNSGTDDTALDLKVQSGEAPMTVNSSAKVANLNSDQQDGVDSTGFIQGKGNIYHGGGNRSSIIGNPVLTVPGFGFILGHCPTAGGDDLSFQNNSGGPLDVTWLDSGGAHFTNLADGGSADIATSSFDAEVVVPQAGRAGRMATITATKNSFCQFSAQAVAQID